MGAVTNPKEPKISNRMHRHRRFDMSYVEKKQRAGILEFVSISKFRDVLYGKETSESSLGPPLACHVSICPMWERNLYTFHQ
jgi:hypothetical protein